MLKMYHTRAHPGSSPDFWDENWKASPYEESVRFCEVDPLRPLFEKYLRPGSAMLEGGCGLGQYVTYYGARGYRVVGLDFALDTLKTLQIRQPDAALCGGDVSCLPFADQTFDLYYSGGVVEHFEGGAKDSLMEARRVLKRDGVFLISVPYFSPLRCALAPFRTSEWRRVKESFTDEDDPFEGKKFFQYAYTTKEFEKILANSGFRTIERQGYAVLWGLYELPFMARFQSEPLQEGHAKPHPDPVEFNAAERSRKPSEPLLKRLVVSEDDSIPVLGIGVKIMRWSVANMMMYVCRRK